MTFTEEAVEVSAKAMAEAAGFNWEACAQSQWIRDARAGLAAAAAVMAKVPVEPISCNLPFERVPTCASDPGTVPKNDNGRERAIIEDLPRKRDE